MDGYLKTYKLKFRTIGPVFIGSGNKIGKKEYIKAGNIAYVPDIMKMYDGLKRMKLNESFESFYLDGCAVIIYRKGIMNRGYHTVWILQR